MKPLETPHIHFAADTHEGMSGKNNEDNFGIFSYQLNEKDPTPVLLSIVSDGIGGHRAGEIASEIAVRTINRRMAGGIVADENARVINIMRSAVVEASAAIHKQAQANPEQKGMGATVAVVTIIGDRLFTATIGDSPIFLIRDQRIQQLSIDHTWIQEALDSGLLTPEQAEGHPNAHIIRRYLGGPNPPDVDFRMKLAGNEPDILAVNNQGTTVKAGDRILSCSDGLTDLVKPHEILKVVLENKSLDTAVEILIAMANERGGHDNITIALLEITRESIAATRAARSTSRAPIILAGFLGIVIVAVIAGFLFLRMGDLIPGLLGEDTPTVAVPVDIPEIDLSPTPLPPTETEEPTPTITLTHTITSTTTSTFTITPTETATPTITAVLLETQSSGGDAPPHTDDDIPVDQPTSEPPPEVTQNPDTGGNGGGDEPPPIILPTLPSP